jgi:hypothetical protein
MTTPTLREAAQAALTALEAAQSPQRWPFAVKQDTASAIRTLRAALAQPVPDAEPMVDGWPLYSGLPPAAHPQPAPLPLTEAQIHAMKCAAADQGITGIAPSLHLARAVEAWHGIVPAPTTDKEQ